ncbi:dynactin-associated protein [Oryx dammah]|uniref:dynactin-associated protein n=1 Tax=Oryx dammah TaxID=59534 RepID=UPI001A9AFB63|nr:dynactin-associated protein [Oryx dammah]
MGDTNPFRMDGKQQQHTVDIEQNPTELLPRNPYGSNEGTHCGCRLPVVTLQPQWAAARPWSPWKTFLLCLLACLIATALVVLLFYFVHLGKPAAGTTIVIHADGKPSHITCIPGAAPSPGPSSLPVSQSTLPPTPGTNHSSSTPGLSTPMETTMSSTLVHEVEIEDEE